MTLTELRWIRTDNGSDLFNSLEHCLLSCTLTRGDERNWKWTVIAAHSAAQAVMVIVLIGQDQNEHLCSDSRKRLLAYFHKRRTNPGAKYPYTRLADFMTLYDACQRHLPAGVATEAHKTSLERLNYLRNHWTHFGEAGSSVAVEMARSASLAGIRLVDQLLPTSTEYFSSSLIDASRQRAVVSSLLALLALDDLDTSPGDMTEDEKWAELLARYGDIDDAE